MAHHKKTYKKKTLHILYVPHKSAANCDDYNKSILLYTHAISTYGEPLPSVMRLPLAGDEQCYCHDARGTANEMKTEFKLRLSLYTI